LGSGCRYPRPSTTATSTITPPAPKEPPVLIGKNLEYQELNIVAAAEVATMFQQQHFSSSKI